MPKEFKADADGPTTLVLHGCPSRKRLVDILKIFQDSLGFGPDCFDFLYMPLRVGSGRRHRMQTRSYGYMFVNFVSSELALSFARAVRHHPLGRETASCEKVCCGVAQCQGLVGNLALVDESPTEGTGVPRLARYGSLWYEVTPGGRLGAVRGATPF